MLTFTIPGRAPASCSPNSRVHWRTKHKDGAAYQFAAMLLAAQAKQPGFGEPWERATVTFTQRSVRLRDADNFGAAMKPALDGIVKAGIIADDNPGCIDLVLRAEKVAHKADECVLVAIERKGVANMEGTGMQHRHGDVILTPEALPKGAKAVERAGDVVLAYGEVTGHAHRYALAVLEGVTQRTHDSWNCNYTSQYPDSLCAGHEAIAVESAAIKKLEEA